MILLLVMFDGCLYVYVMLHEIVVRISRGPVDRFGFEIHFTGIIVMLGLLNKYRKVLD